MKYLTDLPQPKVRGLMQNTPLLISTIIEHAAVHHHDQQIISKLTEQPDQYHYSTYKQVAERSRQLAQVLLHKFNIVEADVIGTISFNHVYHLECIYGISGIAAILHTINPRLYPEQLEYIINHGQDKILFVDYACVPILAGLYKAGKRFDCVKNIVIMTPQQHYQQCAQQLKAVTKVPLHSYDELLSQYSTKFEWPIFHDDTCSSLCYTSGTTGLPKGVSFSHRSTVLHALACTQRDVLDIYSECNILVVVPMFHANAWGVAYTGPMVGSRLLLPGQQLDGAALYKWCTELNDANATDILGVPTVLLTLVQYVEANPHLKHPILRRVGVGGSASPMWLIQHFTALGTNYNQVWGMTETSPIGVSCQLLPKHKNLSQDNKFKVMAKAGRGFFNVECRVVDPDGKECPRDGKTSGELQVRGPFITNAYYRRGSDPNKPVEPGHEVPNVDQELFFSTGDVAAIDADGYIIITDRVKDVIKSGGEWISSIELENAATAHPNVKEACVIGQPHTKWQERPLMFIVKKEGKDVTADEIMQHLKPKVATWWLPSGIEFIDEIPKTATGKLSKLTLRDKYKNYRFPDDKVKSKL